MTSDARSRPLDGDQAGASTSVVEDDAVVASGEDGSTGTEAGETAGRTGTDTVVTDTDVTDTDVTDADAETGSDADGPRPALPLVPVLAVLLVLLVAAGAFLWFTRPEESSIRTDDYSEALQAARSNVVDLTSFDHLTLDDDIRQIERVSTGDLSEETVAQLDERRQDILDAQAVVSTEVVGAGVTRADGDEATVLLVIESTQKSADSPQAQVLRYRIEVEQKKIDGRWLLSAIRGG